MGNKCFGGSGKTSFNNVIYFKKREDNDLNFNIFQIGDSYLLSLLLQASNKLHEGILRIKINP
jgi:hypothetical protein